VLCGQIDDARTYFQRLVAAAPDYGVQDFLDAHPFRLERDLGLVRNAFELMQAM